MTTTKTLLLLPGDGIGPEVMAQAKRVLDWVQARSEVRFNVTEDLVGGAAIDAHGVPVTDATVAKAIAADAVLFGSVGGPKWESVPFESAPRPGRCACARTWRCSPICARRKCSTRWPKPPR